MAPGPHSHRLLVFQFYSSLGVRVPVGDTPVYALGDPVYKPPSKTQCVSSSDGTETRQQILLYTFRVSWKGPKLDSRPFSVQSLRSPAGIEIGWRSACLPLRRSWKGTTLGSSFSSYSQGPVQPTQGLGRTHTYLCLQRKGQTSVLAVKPETALWIEFQVWSRASPVHPGLIQWLGSGLLRVLARAAPATEPWIYPSLRTQMWTLKWTLVLAPPYWIRY